LGSVFAIADVNCGGIRKVNGKVTGRHTPSGVYPLGLYVNIPLSLWHMASLTPVIFRAKEHCHCPLDSTHFLFPDGPEGRRLSWPAAPF